MHGQRMRAWWSVVVLAGLLATGPLTALARAESTPPVCTAGSSGIGDGYFPMMGNSGYDARHYTLDLDLDVPNGAIRSGRATMQATATSPLCAFNLDLNGLTVDSVNVDGAPAVFSRRGQELTITPRSPLPRGGEFVVDVAYHGTPFTLDTPTLAQTQAVFDSLGAGALFGATPGPDAALATPVENDAAVATPTPDDGSPLMIGLGMDTDRYGWSLGGWWKAGDSIFVAGEPRGAETWYPVNGHPADKATYTFRLTVDKPYLAVANGPLVQETETADTVTTVYAPRDPIASYLVTVHAGQLDVVNADGPDGTPLRFVFAKSVSGHDRALLMNTTRDVLRLFVERYGPYPFDLAGGTIVDSPLYFALETQTMPIYGALPAVPGLTDADRAAMDQSTSETIAHEMAHQWFGDSASVLRWQDVFLAEGLAQYSTYLWIEQRQGRAVMLQRLQDSWSRVQRAGVLSDPAQLATMSAKDLLVAAGFDAPEVEHALAAQMGLDSSDALATTPALAAMDALSALGLPFDNGSSGWPVLTGDPGPENLFSNDVIYERGSLTLHALRLQIGDDAFFETLRRYAATYHNGNATIEDFIAVAEDVSGQDLQPLFDAWLFQRALPPLDLSR